jgi:hypothetical protein
MKMNVFYALLLAIIRVRLAWPTLLPLIPEPKKPSDIGSAAVESLLILASALEYPEGHPKLSAFAAAAAERTNVKAQRETRVRFLVRALIDAL